MSEEKKASVLCRACGMLMDSNESGHHSKAGDCIYMLKCANKHLERENHELREEKERVEEKVKQITNNAINLLMNNVCDAHSEEAKKMSFDEFQQSKFCQCIACAIAALDAAYEKAAKVADELGKNGLALSERVAGRKLAAAIRKLAETDANQPIRTQTESEVV